MKKMKVMEQYMLHLYIKAHRHYLISHFDNSDRVSTLHFLKNKRLVQNFGPASLLND